ncbi:flagellar motor stator protein MotA [Marichromatium bheemlicum]|uniref:Flagellar motor stator protein MotA n=1 Tax=Marichromatium bheemlicum TaxID=365339 RepID=A0ABX1I7H3_9GAMM|nr:flagellar motor stator protein MotA [Marichromatium bheemlicum]NKN33504.1 flagellar motor stator protein MotA [Marichromatium bheemlicum]
MKLLLGALITLAAVLGGFAAHGGNLLAIWQPYEIVIICGAALGAFIIANPRTTIVETLTALPQLLRGPRYTRADYLDLLALMFKLFGKIRKDGLMGVEADIEEPRHSPLFRAHPRLLQHPHALEFISDYMRLVVSGGMNPFELDALMEVDLSAHHESRTAAAHAVQRSADALPAFGIVAAVLGIVKTMSALGGALEEIGALVAAALVGTFLGVLIAYGFIGPIATAMEHRAEEELQFLTCIKACILANVQGYSPQIAVEFGRKSMHDSLRPSFAELERHLRGGRAR